MRKNVVSAAVEKIGAHPCCKNDLFNAVFGGTFEEPGNQIGISILEMYPSEKKWELLWPKPSYYGGDSISDLNYRFLSFQNFLGPADDLTDYCLMQ